MKYLIIYSEGYVLYADWGNNYGRLRKTDSVWMVPGMQQEDEGNES